ncbi:MAG: alginate lyase family protein, partial [Candidatus Acidiferrales bacterium]
MQPRATFALALAAISILAVEAPLSLRAQSATAMSPAPSAAVAQPAAIGPRVFRTPPATLAALRERIAAGNFSDPALDQLRADADRALAQAPLSVIDKQIAPPSGDKHDYMTLAPYWWPDPSKPDGLPYIRRDGQTNPEIHKIPDHQSFDTLTSSAYDLALAYYLFRDESYATHAELLLRAWFLDPATRMNPNLQYAQAVRGVNEGRGTG